MIFNFLPPPHQSKLSELETQVQATRSRTLKLLKEKDTEIQKLRTELQTGGRGYSEYPMETKRQLSSQGSTSSLPEGGEEGEERGGLNLPIKVSNVILLYVYSM